MTYENLLYEKKGRVAVVTLNRPEYLNGIAPGMGQEIADVFHAMDEDDEVRVSVFTGAGRAFCSGAFIRDPNTHSLESAGEAVLRRSGRDGAWGDRAIDGYTKPLIAAVNGPAYGAGFNMALLSDIIIASTAARFCFPMSRLGIMPAVSGGPRLMLRVGLSKALEMAIMARPIDGEEAYRCGLANKVVPPEQLMDEAIAWAAEIAVLAPISTKLAKEDIRESWQHHINAYANAMRFRLSMMTEDRAEGHAAWREKRDPDFKGR
jgi:enoyl-CoA hydratase/carnithine racemase